MFPNYVPGPASRRARNPKPAPPSDRPHTSTRTAARPCTAPRCAPVERATPACAPPATRSLPPLRLSARAILLAPPIASPASHSPAPAGAADYSETSPRRSAHRSSASSAPALLRASVSRVGPQPLPQVLSCGDTQCPASHRAPRRTGCPTARPEPVEGSRRFWETWELRLSQPNRRTRAPPQSPPSYLNPPPPRCDE